MANQEVDLSCINEFRREMQVSMDTRLWIGGVEVKHQILPQIMTIHVGQGTFLIKRMVIPRLVMDSFMNGEDVSFKVVHSKNIHTIEGICCLNTCVEGGSSAHYRALEDVVLLVRVK